jgi:glycerol 3-phosphatase-1
VYAKEALAATGLTRPTAFVGAEDVSKGKPKYDSLVFWDSITHVIRSPTSPEPYLAGAQKCGVDPTKCMSFSRQDKWEEYMTY